MGAGGPFTEQNGGAVDGCLPALGGGDDGVESDCDLSLDMLSWTSDDGEILEMWDVDSAEGDGGGGVVLKEDPELSSINGRGGDNGGNGNDEDAGRESKEDLEMAMAMPTNGCYRDDSDNIGGGEERVMRKGPWTPAEDALLVKVVEELGSGDWVAIERYSGLARTSKSCRLRWTNHLRPNLKKGSFSLEEERQVVGMHYKYGNKWSRMARHLPGRTDNEIKNFWHSRVKKCKKQGVPIYPDWCREEEKTSKGDQDYGVDEQPNYISATHMDKSSTAPLFAAVSLPEDQPASSHPSYPHDQESLTRCSNQTNLPNSSVPAKNHLAFTQQPPHSYQTDGIAVLESHPSQSHVSLSYHQPPHISTDDVPQDQRSSAFNLATGPSPEVQYYSSRGQYFFSSSHNYSSSDKTKPLHCLPISSSSALPQLSLPEKSRSLSAQQPSSKYQPNLSFSNNSYIPFKHFRPPPILSPPPGRFKRLHKPSSQLPPVPKPTQSSFPEKGQSASASAASVSNFHLNASSSAPQSSSELKLPKVESAGQSIQVSKSTLTPPAPGPEINSLITANPHSFLAMKVSTQTPPESYGQIKSSITAGPGSSLKRYLPTSELPVCSQHLHSSTPSFSSIGMSEPPSIQSSRRDLNEDPEMKLSLMTGKSKSYSDLSDASLLQEIQVEPSLSDLHLVKGYLLSKRLKMKQLYGNTLGRRMQQNISSNKGVLLGGSPERKGFLTRSLSDVMMRKSEETEDLTGNNSHRSFPLNGSSNTVNFSSGKSTKECLINIGSYGKDLLDRSGGMAVPGDNSRKEDLLIRKTTKKGLPNEVSKTGVLLVEDREKENLLRELLKREDPLALSLQREVPLKEGFVPEDPMMIKSLASESFPNGNSSKESLKRKGPMTESLEKDGLMSTSSKRDQSSREVLTGKNLSEGFSNPQEQASVAGEHGHLNLTSFPVSNVSTGNLHSAEIPASNHSYSRTESSKRLCLRDEHLKGDSLEESSEREGPLAIHGQEYIFDALSPLFKQSTATASLRSNDSFRESTYFQSYVGDKFAESLEGEWSKNLQKGCIENKTLTNQFLGESMKEEGLLESQDKSNRTRHSNLLPCQYAAPGLTQSGHPGAELSSGGTSMSENLERCVKFEDSFRKSLEKSNTCNKAIGKEHLKESLTEEQALATIEPKPSQNGLDPVINQSTTDYMLRPRVQTDESGSHYHSSGDVKGLIRENSEGKRELALQQPNLLENGESGSGHQPAGKEMLQKAEEHVNSTTLPDELSSLLQFFATTAREFTGMQFFEQLDMSLGLDPPLLSPPIKVNAAAE